jgi:hypothetical protein
VRNRTNNEEEGNWRWVTSERKKRIKVRKGGRRK